jgi:hypothetical protein
MAERDCTDAEILAGLKTSPVYSHVCLCGFAAPAADKGREAKCCQVCPGCNQRIKRAELIGHTGTCVAYGQVTGKIPLDNSWWMDDPHLWRWSFGQPHVFRLGENQERRKRGRPRAD